VRRYRLSEVQRALESSGFSAEVIDTREELWERVEPLIRDFETAGFGGSMTTRELGLPELCESIGLKVFDHWTDGLTPEQISGIRRAHLACDVFFTSAQAITMNGEIVSIDGIGNRVAATIFGPKRVVVVCGKNKIVSDLHAAFERIRRVAAPLRAKSLNVDVPCAKTGECTDCSSPERICRAAVIMYAPPLRADVRVFIVNEELGY